MCWSNEGRLGNAAAESSELRLQRRAGTLATPGGVIARRVPLQLSRSP
jgi:hypothetical protein